MSAADKKVRDAYNKLRTTTNKKHTCKYCKHDYFKKCIGNHLFSAHADEMRTALAAYKMRITKPSLPLKAGADMYVCLCCHEIWNTAGRATAHIAKCGPEAQIKALYAFLDCDAPTAEITVRVPVAGAVKEAADENAVLLKTIHAQKIELEKLASVKLDQTSWKAEKTRQKINYLEYVLSAKVRILVEQRDAALSRIPQADKTSSFYKEVNDIQYDDETRAELQKRAEDIKLYVANTFNDECFIVKRAAPEPEPTPEPEPEPVPEPELQPAAKLEPEPEHNGCYVCAHDFIANNEKGKCITCRKTCHIYDDFIGCYLYDCEKCDGRVCLPCVKAAGGNKMHPYCSEKCKAPHDAIYLESRSGVKYVSKHAPS